MLTKQEVERWNQDKSNLIPTGVRLPKSFITEIKAISKKEGISRGHVIRRALSRDFLARQLKGVSQ